MAKRLIRPEMRRTLAYPCPPCSNRPYLVFDLKAVEAQLRLDYAFHQYASICCLSGKDRSIDATHLNYELLSLTYHQLA